MKKFVTFLESVGFTLLLFQAYNWGLKTYLDGEVDNAAPIAEIGECRHGDRYVYTEEVCYQIRRE